MDGYIGGKKRVGKKGGEPKEIRLRREFFDSG